MKLTPELLKKLVRASQKTLSEEIGCDDCFDQLHEFAELELSGKTPEKAMPLVQDHLNKCGECRQEYQALLDALRELNS